MALTSMATGGGMFRSLFALPPANTTGGHLARRRGRNPQGLLRLHLGADPATSRTMTHVSMVAFGTERGQPTTEPHNAHFLSTVNLERFNLM